MLNSLFGRKEEEARIKIEEDGTTTLYVGTFSQGQGHATVFPQIMADKLGIEKPHKIVAAGLGKRAIKAEIRELKLKRQAALEAKDHAELKKYRRKIHRRKRRLRRMMELS